MKLEKYMVLRNLLQYLRERTAAMVRREIIYYTDNVPSERFLNIIQRQILRACGDIPIISVSQKPIDFGRNIVMAGIGRSNLSIYRQILTGLEASDADVVNFVEHDVIYHPGHFEFVPPDNTAFWYNRNVWKVRASDGQAVYYRTSALSLMVCYRDIALKQYRERVEKQANGTLSRATGHEPGHHLAPKGLGNIPAKFFNAEHPCIDIRHSNNKTKTDRFRKESFRSKKSILDWKLADEVPFWGRTKGRFNEFLLEIDR